MEETLKILSQTWWLRLYHRKNTEACKFALLIFSISSDKKVAFGDAVYNGQLHLTTGGTMRTFLQFAFLVCSLAVLLPLPTHVQQDAKNPGCDPDIHICPDNPSTLNLM